VAAGTVGTRVWDFISRLATLTHEQRRQSQDLEKLQNQVAALALEVREMKGKLDQIEKRFDDKDAAVKATIALEVEKLRAELKRGS